MLSLPLLDAIEQRPRGGRSPETIRAAFEEFHRSNPRVYELLVKFARQVKAAGHARYSMDAIFHRVRWHVMIETRDSSDFKLNDHYTALFSRLIMEREPDLKDFFEVRARRSA
jgi:hypothetical protein